MVTIIAIYLVILTISFLLAAKIGLLRTSIHVQRMFIVTLGQPLSWNLNGIFGSGETR